MAVIALFISKLLYSKGASIVENKRYVCLFLCDDSDSLIASLDYVSFFFVFHYGKER